MEASLVLVKSDGTTREVSLKRARTVIGREKKCDVRIPVASVSREHCEVRTEGGRVFVRDLGSSNGTYVNRARVQEVEVKAGDLVAIGPAVFAVRVDGQPSQIDARKLSALGAGPAPLGTATGGARARPSAPAPGAKPGAKATPVADLEDSSVADFDFDFLDEDEEDTKKL